MVLVSHGGAINNLVSGVLGATGTFFFNPGYTSICRLDVMSSGRLVVVSVNETGHLVADRDRVDARGGCRRGGLTCRRRW